MARVHLSIDDNLFKALEAVALTKSTTVNLLIIDILEELYSGEAFNYSEALKTLVDEAKAHVKDVSNPADFTLSTLRSYSKICVAEAGKGTVRPSMVRARLGKLFNAKVGRGEVEGVCRAEDEFGHLKFSEKAAVYTRVPPSQGERGSTSIEVGKSGF